MSESLMSPDSERDHPSEQTPTNPSSDSDSRHDSSVVRGLPAILHEVREAAERLSTVQFLLYSAVILALVGMLVLGAASAAGAALDGIELLKWWS